MDSALSFVLVENVYVFLLIFTRFGTALILMPGFGDFFTPMQVRLLFALSLSFALTPVFYETFPVMPNELSELAGVIGYEFLVGALIGVISRILISALDTAGMIIAINIGLANAQMFNPGARSQGSLIGTFFYIIGVLLIFATNLHHVMLYAIYESYNMLPPLSVPDIGAIADLVAQSVSRSFYIGFKLAVPFVVIGLVLYVSMGVMGRLMPQVQIFMLALPMQILVGFLTLSLTLSAIMVYWLRYYEQGMLFFMSP